MACLEGFEPPTFWFVAKHSIRLSYRHMMRGWVIICAAARPVKRKSRDARFGRGGRAGENG